MGIASSGGLRRDRAQRESTELAVGVNGRCAEMLHNNQLTAGHPAAIPEIRDLMARAIGFSSRKLSSGLRSKFGGLQETVAEKEGAPCAHLIPMLFWFMASQAIWRTR
jgi:hypothetical protein